MTNQVEETPKPTSLGEWKKAATHTVRLPSGQFVGIKIPDLAGLIEAGEIPQNLLEAALAATEQGAEARAKTKESILQEKEFTDRLVFATVVQPKLTEADVQEIPFPDKVMIAEFATRQRDMDVEGNHIGGLEKSDKFRKFRGLDQFDTSLEDL